MLLSSKNYPVSSPCAHVVPWPFANIFLNSMEEKLNKQPIKFVLKKVSKLNMYFSNIV